MPRDATAPVNRTPGSVDSLLEFLHMGGYAFYVWMSYAIVAVMLTINLVLPLRRARRLRARLQRQFVHEPATPHGHEP